MRRSTVIAIATLAAALGLLAGLLLSGASDAQPERPAGGAAAAPSAEGEPRRGAARDDGDATWDDRQGRAASATRSESDSEPPPATEEPPPPGVEPEQRKRRWPAIRWRRSRAIGQPFAGRLHRGVRLPRAGRDFVTWDPIRRGRPNRHWRRWGTRRLLRVILRVAREHRAANPDAPRLIVGDLSRPRGGDFGPRFGGIGHASHQNGLDVDIYYPRLDRREIRPGRVDLVDLELAQDLVTRFVRAGAEYVFVGPSTPLTGPRGRVQPLVHHDDHLHVRLLPAHKRRR